MSKLRSRKLWVAIGGIAGVVLVNLGVPEDLADRIADGIMGLAGIYIVTEGVVDAVASRASK